MAAVNLRTAAEIPWPTTADLGMGVAAPSGDLLKTAVKRVRAAPGGTVEVNAEVTEVTSSSDIKTALGVESKAQFSTPAVAGSAMVKYAQSVRHSALERTLLYLVTMQWGDALASPLPELTAKAARQARSGPTTFRDSYGDYFIAGYTKKAEFLAFAHITATSEETVRTVTTQLKGELNKPGVDVKAEVLTELSNEAHKSHCEVSVELHMTGLRADDAPEGGAGAAGGSSVERPLDHLALDELPEQLRYFTDHAEGRRTTAHLVHYHRVEPSIPTRIPLDSKVFLAAQGLYDDCLDAWATLRKLPPPYAEDMRERLEDLERRIDAEIPRDLTCTVSTITNLRHGLDGLDRWVADAEETLAYFALWKAATTNRAGHLTGVDAGTDGTVVEPLPAVSVHESYDRPGHIDVDLMFGPDGIRKRVRPAGRGYRSWVDAAQGPDLAGKAVCGYRLTTSRTGSKAGRIEVTSGGVGKDRVGFHARSDYDRGLDWTVQVYVVPQEHFAFTGEAAGART